jgi:HK97 family phage portal protein
VIGRSLLERRSAGPTSSTGIATNLSQGIPGLGPDGARDGLGVPAWWAGVRIISSAVAMIPCEVLLRTDQDVVSAARDSRLWRLLGVSANRENSAGQVWEFVLLSLLQRGNAFLWKERDELGRVVALWPIRAGRVHVARDIRTREKQYWIATSTDDADFAPLKTSDVLHIRGPGDDPLVGWSPLRFQRELLQRSKGEGVYQKAQLDNGVRPSGVLETDGTLSPDAAAKLKASWDAAHGGGRNAGGTIVLEDGLTWRQVSLSAADAQFLQTRQFTRQEIAMILDLPAQRLLASEGSGLRYSSSAMDTKAFVQQTVAPWTARIERALLQDPDLPWAFTGLKAGTLFPKFNLDVLANADPTERFANYESARRAGWIKPDEVRVREGMPLSGDPSGGLLTAPTASKPPVKPEGPTP